MTFTVATDKTRNIVCLKFSGAPDLGDHVASRAQVLRLCEEKRIKKLLVDLSDITGSDSFGNDDQVRFGESWESQKLPEGFELAVVMPRGETDQVSYFFVQYLTKAMGVLIRTFEGVGNAVDWLLDDEKLI